MDIMSHDVLCINDTTGGSNTLVVSAHNLLGFLGVGQDRPGQQTLVVVGTLPRSCSSVASSCVGYG
jgi:hypothetical protein